MLVKHGLRFIVAVWDPAYKGLDDFNWHLAQRKLIDDSTELGSHEIKQGLSPWRETLYRHRSGAYFVNVKGGPDLASGEEQIRELTASEAEAWAKEHLSVKKVPAFLSEQL